MTIMTTSQVAATPTPAHILGTPEVRRGLEAQLRQRVPSQDVEDLAQAVLADALASPSIPRDGDGLRRWLSAIARHRIADFHRRRARTRAWFEPDEAAEAVASNQTAFEERQVLHALLGESRSQREAETLRWLLREHAGDRLVDIATEHGVPAPVVRQRISRLRRLLRARWQVLGGLATLLALALVVGASVSDAPSAASITLEPPREAVVGDEPVDLREAGQGDWVVRAVVPDRALSAAEQRLVDREAVGARISVTERRIVLRTARGFTTSWRITRFQKASQGAQLTLVHEDGPTSTADVRLLHDDKGDRLEVSLHDPRFGGTVTLRRPTR